MSKSPGFSIWLTSVVLFAATLPGNSQQSPFLYVSYCSPSSFGWIDEAHQFVQKAIFTCGYTILEGTAPPKTERQIETISSEILQRTGARDASIVTWLPLPKGIDGSTTSAGSPPSGSLFVTFFYVTDAGYFFGSRTLKDRGPPLTNWDFFALEETIRSATHAPNTVVLSWTALSN